MTLLLTEGIADATLKYFRDFQKDKIEDVAGRSWSVALEMGPLKAIRYSEPGREIEPDFPIVYMIPEESDGQQLAKGGSAGAWAHQFEFVVIAHHAGLGTDDLDRPGAGKVSPTEAVKRLAGRYAIAVFEMLKDMGAVDIADTYKANGERLRWGAPRFIHGITYAAQSGEMLADVRILIGLEHYETRT